MKIIFISDTHNRLDQIIDDIPVCDVLVHCGDMTGRGYAHEINKHFKTLSKLRDRGYIDHFVGIAGNHDLSFEDHPEQAKELVPDWYHYLENSEVTINGIKFYGSPQTPRFFDWGFNVDRGPLIREYWDKIPLDTDVLVTHGPPYGILDIAIRNGEHVGCEELWKAVQRVQPKVHAFGHIHHWHGIKEVDSIKFINASNLGEDYRYVNKPILIDLGELA